MQKRILIIAVTAACGLFTLTGCSKQSKTESSTGQVTPEISQEQSETEQNIENQESENSNTEEQMAQDQSQTLESDIPASTDLDNVITITEKMYVTWINEIYLNAEDYLGKTISIEGMYTNYTPEDSDVTYHYVYRVGPGCCGNDGSMCGFEFTYDGELPNDNDWIELTGVLELYEEDGYQYLSLRATDIEVKSERGAETVYQ